MATRQQITSQAVQGTKPRTSAGGVTAPASTARSASTGIGRGRVAPGSGRGIGNNRPAPAVKPSTPAPAAPAPAVPTPWDTRYEQRVSGARKTYLDSTANLDLAEQTAKQDYGIDPGFNDYQANPTSRAAALEAAYKTANRGTMAGAGYQLYSGSTSNRLGTNRRDYDFNRDSLAKEYRDYLNEIDTGRLKAKEDQEQEERDAYWQRVEAAENAPVTPIAPPTPSGPGAYSKNKRGPRYGISTNKAAPAPKKKGKK